MHEPLDTGDRDSNPVRAVVELVPELVDRLLELEDGEQPLRRALAGREEGRVVTAVAHPDAREHLRDGIRASCAYFAAYRDVHRVLFSTAALDPEATAGAVQRSEANRAGGMAYLAQRLAEQNFLRPDLTVDAAAHILFVITSFDAFDLLYTGRDLPVDEIARLLEPGVREQLVKGLRGLGYQFVTVDLEGLRSGSLNVGAGVGAPDSQSQGGIQTALGASGVVPPGPERENRNLSNRGGDITLAPHGGGGTEGDLR